MSKRKRSNSNNSSKRVKGESEFDNDTDIEEDLLKFADDYEDWGEEDEEMEQLMCEAVDEFERNQRGAGNEDRQSNDSQLSDDQVQDNNRDDQSPDEREEALNGSVNVTSLHPRRTGDILQAFHELEARILEELRSQLRRHRNIRARLVLEATYSRISVDGERYEIQTAFRSQFRVLTNEEELESEVAEMMKEIYEHSQEFDAQGSGWSLQSIDGIQIYTVQYKPLAGSSYITTPYEISVNPEHSE